VSHPVPQNAKFAKSRRLLRHADFERVYKQGRRHFAAHMTVFYLRRAEGESGDSRVGLTVGRILGGAVQRNRIKRRLREAVRLSRPGFSAPVDMVINPKRSALNMDFVDLRQELTTAFQVIERSLEKEKGNPRG